MICHNCNNLIPDDSIYCQVCGTRQNPENNNTKPLNNKLREGNPGQQPRVQQPPIEQPQLERPSVQPALAQQPVIEQPQLEQPSVQPALVKQPPIQRPPLKNLPKPPVANAKAEERTKTKETGGKNKSPIVIITILVLIIDLALGAVVFIKVIKPILNKDESGYPKSLISNDGKEEYFDPFDGIRVTFSGVSGNGRVSIDGSPTHKAAQEFFFTADRKEGLSEGDRITITAYISFEDDAIEYCRDHYGAVPLSLTKVYVVNGLESTDQLYPDSSQDSDLGMEEDSINGRNYRDLFGDNDHDDNGDEEYDEYNIDGIVFPESSSEIIDSDIITELSDEELRFAINEIYARNGYIFNNSELTEYYEQYDWYEKKYSSEEFSFDYFNSIEKENIEAMQKERNRRT